MLRCDLDERALMIESQPDVSGRRRTTPATRWCSSASTRSGTTSSSTGSPSVAADRTAATRGDPRPGRGLGRGGDRLFARKPARDDLRDAVGAHRDAVEHVGRLHRPLLVRDHDELRAVGVAPKQLDEAADVRVVERGLDLVEEVERARAARGRARTGTRSRRAPSRRPTGGRAASPSSRRAGARPRSPAPPRTRARPGAAAPRRPGRASPRPRGSALDGLVRLGEAARSTVSVEVRAQLLELERTRSRSSRWVRSSSSRSFSRSYSSFASGLTPPSARGASRAARRLLGQSPRSPSAGSVAAASSRRRASASPRPRPSRPRPRSGLLRASRGLAPQLDLLRAERAQRPPSPRAARGVDRRDGTRGGLSTRPPPARGREPGCVDGAPNSADPGRGSAWSGRRPAAALVCARPPETRQTSATPALIDCPRGAGVDSSSSSTASAASPANHSSPAPGRSRPSRVRPAAGPGTLLRDDPAPRGTARAPACRPCAFRPGGAWPSTRGAAAPRRHRTPRPQMPGRRSAGRRRPRARSPARRELREATARPPRRGRAAGGIPRAPRGGLQRGRLVRAVRAARRAPPLLRGVRGRGGALGAWHGAVRAVRERLVRARQTGPQRRDLCASRSVSRSPRSAGGRAPRSPPRAYRRRRSAPPRRCSARRAATRAARSRALRASAAAVALLALGHPRPSVVEVELRDPRRSEAISPPSFSARSAAVACRASGRAASSPLPRRRARARPGARRAAASARRGAAGA